MAPRSVRFPVKEKKKNPGVCAWLNRGTGLALN